MTWQSNWDTCCSLGMTPLNLDSASEQTCLSNLTKSSNWTGNHNYWTGGTQQDCRGSWAWCEGGAAPMSLSDDVKWASGQPDNLGGRQDCVHLQNIKDIGLMLTDRNCTDKYILACKVRLSYQLYKLGGFYDSFLIYRETLLQSHRKIHQIVRTRCAPEM